MKRLGYCFFIMLLITSCFYNKQDEYTIPQGFEEFTDCKAHYRVFASLPDTVYNIMIKALMTAYFDTVNNRLLPTTTYIIKHSSGDSIKIVTNDKLIDLEDFRSFVNSHTQRYNDTIISLVKDYEIKPQGHEYNLSNLVDPFCFLDVSFKGYPSLLVRRIDGPCSYYSVYGIMSDNMRKVSSPPYNQFKTATSNWLLGYGTNIDYNKKEIIVPSLGPGSCSDFGVFIYDCYALNNKTDSFTHHRKTQQYAY